MKPGEVALRRFEERDRDAVRGICHRTGQRGRPTQVFFEDEKIVSMLYADYYMDYEPECCFVAEVDGRVVGYTVSSLKPKLRRRVFWTRIYPRVLVRMLWKTATFQYRQRQTYRTMWWMLTRSWRERLPIPVGKYAGHSHTNVEDGYRSRRLGEKLTLRSRQNFIERGVRGVPVVVREEEGDDSLSTFVCRVLAYRVASVTRQTVWDKPTGKKWYAKVLLPDPERWVGPSENGDVSPKR